MEENKEKFKAEFEPSKKMKGSRTEAKVNGRKIIKIKKIYIWLETEKRKEIKWYDSKQNKNQKTSKQK